MKKNFFESFVAYLIILHEVIKLKSFEWLDGVLSDVIHG